MSTPARFIVYALLAIVGVYLGMWVLKSLVSFIWSIVLPVAVLGVIGYVAYSYMTRKSLGRGPRSLR